MAFQEGERGTEQRVVLRFRDGELLEAVARRVDIDQPAITVHLVERGAPQEVVVPFGSLKSVLLRRDEFDPPDGPAGMRKAALHFWDGEVLTGYVGGGPERHVHGMVLPLVSPTLDEIEVFAIPHAAVKGLFFVDRWDGVPDDAGGNVPGRRGAAGPPLLAVLGEIRVLSRMHVRGDIDSTEYQRRRLQVLSRL